MDRAQAGWQIDDRRDRLSQANHLLQAFLALPDLLISQLALGLIGGATVAGGVQLVKAKVRLATSALTAGTGNWAVSLTEDAAAVGTIALAVAAPLLFGAVASTALALVAILFAMRHQRKELALVRARAAAA